MKLVFDIETDGLLENVTKIHCIVARDVSDNNKEYIFKEDTIGDGIEFLKKAEVLIGHNIICFDLPVIKKLYDVEPKAIVVDTLVLGRLYFPDRKNRDFKLFRKGNLPPQLIGSHSLKAWGYRIGVNKGKFAEESDFSVFSEDMLQYCQQDVWLNTCLYKKFENIKYSQDAVKLEHRIQEILFAQQEHGFPFNEKAAQKLFSKLNDERCRIATDLKKDVEDWVHEEEFVPKVNSKKFGYEKGVPTIKRTVTEFNPNSREHIARMLQEKYEWKPKIFTETGLPKVDEKVLSSLDYPEAKILTKYLTIQKRLGQLAEGKQAWLKLVKKGKINGYVNPMGTYTSRCTHKNPNMAQIPSVKAAYGVDCRSLFYANDDYSLMGCDASSLELRCLSHYMANWDNGRYGKQVVNDDIHTINQNAAGLPTRDNAKTFIYALIYGAGNEKLGKIIGKGSQEGSRIKAEFFNKIPALKNLTESVQKTAENGYIYGIDKRRIPVMHPHAALNTLLQSCGAILTKRWIVIFHDLLKEKGYIDGCCYKQVAYVHDEVQVLVKKHKGEEIGKICVEAIKKAGEYYNFRVPLDGEFKIGKNWAETH